MVNITLSIPENLHKKMKNFSEIRWSEVARRALEQKVTDMEIIEKIAQKSNFTKEDAKEIAKKIKRSAAIRFNELSA